LKTNDVRLHRNSLPLTKGNVKANVVRYGVHEEKNERKIHTFSSLRR